jgi:hypothetical protein
MINFSPIQNPKLLKTGFLIKNRFLREIAELSIVDDSLIDELEKRIKSMSDVRRIMNDMKHTLSEVKINVEDLKNFEKGLNDALKFTLQIEELDSWTLSTLKSFKEISESGGLRCSDVKKLPKPKTTDFIDLKKAKQGLKERGIEVVQNYEKEFREMLNLSVTMTLDFLATKKEAIEAAQKLIAPYRKPENKVKI